MTLGLSQLIETACQYSEQVVFAPALSFRGCAVFMLVCLSPLQVYPLKLKICGYAEKLDVPEAAQEYGG